MLSNTATSNNNTTNNASDDDYVEEIIPITSENYLNDGCTFQFNFGRNIEFKKGSKIGLVNCSMYNSTQNIRSVYGNNQFSITWIDGTSQSVTIADGYYAYSDIQNLIEYYLIQNNWFYTQNNTAMYAFQISENIPLYSAQLNINPVPSATQATAQSLTIPTGATWSWPANPITPQITFNSALGEIFGFVKNLTFPVGGPLAQVYEYTSDSFPILSPVYVYVMSLNVLNTGISTTNNNIFTGIALNNSFGGLITYGNGSMPQMVDIYPSRYNKLVIKFLDQNLSPIKLVDPELILLLVLKYKV